ncbi:MAG: hypothetical protein WC683_16165 [bacterium]
MAEMTPGERAEDDERAANAAERKAMTKECLGYEMRRYKAKAEAAEHYMKTAEHIERLFRALAKFAVKLAGGEPV